MAKGNKKKSAPPPPPPPPPASTASPSPKTPSLSTTDTVLKLLQTAFGLIGSAFGAAVLLAFIFGNSKTYVGSVKVDADDVIHVNVANRGLRPSTIVGYRLKFQGLPFDAAPLALIEAEGQRARVPRLNLNLKERTLDEGSIDIGLILARVHCNDPGLGEEQIRAKVRTGWAMVELDVQEAKDRPEGPLHHPHSAMFETTGPMETLLMEKVDVGGQR